MDITTSHTRNDSCDIGRHDHTHSDYINNYNIYITHFTKVAKRSENDRKKQQWECNQKPRGKP